MLFRAYSSTSNSHFVAAVAASHWLNGNGGHSSKKISIIFADFSERSGPVATSALAARLAR